MPSILYFHIHTRRLMIMSSNSLPPEVATPWSTAILKQLDVRKNSEKLAIGWA
jgi:hypothetical protein